MSCNSQEPGHHTLGSPEGGLGRLLIDSGKRACSGTVTLAANLWARWLPVGANSSGAATLHVPIRSLGANHREPIAQHLLSLSARDRYLRFGYKAQDHHIAHYVAGLDFSRDEIFGIYDRSLLLIAVAHLAYAVEDQYETAAEFGVSVLSHARNRGYGAQLFERAAMHATNRHVSLIFIHALSENQTMLKIATDAGARIKRHGCESQAFLQLATPSLGSRLSQFVEERVAQTDYRIKAKTQRRPRLNDASEPMRHAANTT